MRSPRLDVKLVHVGGQTVFCTVLPYIPPTPIDELDLSWPKKPARSTTRLGIDPWAVIDARLDMRV